MDQTKTALLIMDMQVGIVERYASESGLVEKLHLAAQTARTHAIPVIYVRVAFRDGYPEVSASNKSFSALSSRGGMEQDGLQTQIHPDIAQGPNDIVVVKRRVSAFAGSDLEVVLRGLDVKHLVLSGIATSGVVLSTLREAADKDFQLTVLSDGCADADAEVHRVLTEKVFPRQADVLTIDEWRSALS